MRVGNVKSWVIQFMCKNLNINAKSEQRNRLGCDRLRLLHKDGISSEQLVKAGCKKCDFFVKQENYNIFLSQIPSLLMRRSISNESDRLSEISTKTFFTINEGESKRDVKGKKKIMFKLHLGKEFEDIVEQYKDSY